MRRPVGITGMAVIAAFGIAAACTAESGAIQSFMSRMASTQVIDRPAGKRVSSARFRAEVDRAWRETLQGRCVAPASFTAPPGLPPAC
jgi:hypothetical protein